MNDLPSFDAIDTLPRAAIPAAMAHLAAAQSEISALQSKLAARMSADAAAVPVDNDRWSTGECARRLDVAQQTVRGWVTEGHLRRGVHYDKPNGRLFFRPSAVLAWVAGQADDGKPAQILHLEQKRRRHGNQG